MIATAPRRFGRALVVTAVVTLVAIPGGDAAEKTHEVRPGESASAIAMRYYGAFEPAGLLLEYNGKHDSVLRVGEILRVPYCPVHRIRSGDSWSTIAQRYLGRMSAYPAIAALNGLAVEAPLSVGREVTVPVVFSHPLRRGETLAVLAERFYGDSSLGSVLQEFNAIDDPRRLSVGSVIEIPVIGLRLAEDRAGAREQRPVVAASAEPERSAPEPDATPEAVPEPEPVARFAQHIAAAEVAFGNGEYERAREMLEELRSVVRAEGSDAEKSDLFRVLAFVYVAFDLRQETCDAWADVVALDPAPRLDPDLVSPKIIEALSRCEPGETRADLKR